MTAAEILAEIKIILGDTIAVEIPSHCQCCPNPYEEGLEVEHDYAKNLLGQIIEMEEKEA